MNFLVGHLWPALAGAFALGLAAGAFGTAPKGMSRSGRARVALAVALAMLAAGASAAALVPGEAGLWLDGLTLHLAAYAAGCAVGYVPGRAAAGRRRRPKEA